MKTLGLTLLLAALGLALSGCADGSGHHAPSSTLPRTATTLPHRSLRSPLATSVGKPGQQSVAGVNLHLGARFLSPTRLAFVTDGSSSCPAIPTRLSVQTPSRIGILLHIQTPPTGICLSDITTTPVVITINPKRINVNHRLTIRLYYPHREKPTLRTAPPYHIY